MKRLFREFRVLAWFGLAWLATVLLLLSIGGGLFSHGLDVRQAAFWDIALKAVGGLAAIVGAVVAAGKFFDEKARNTQVALIEAQKPFFTKRQEVYYELVSATSTLSTEVPDTPGYRAAEASFWHLYWGALPLVTDPEVGGATNAFEDILVDETLDAGVKCVMLRNASKNLAERCRASLGFG